jgi:hypothetical protein
MGKPEVRIVRSPPPIARAFELRTLVKRTKVTMLRAGDILWIFLVGSLRSEAECYRGASIS